MKRILSILAMALFPTVMYAQNDGPFFPAGAGTVLLYENLGADGTVLSFTRDSVAEMTGDFTDGSAIVYSTLRSNDTSSITTREYITFKDGEVITDMIRTMEESMAMAASLETVGGSDDPQAQEAFKAIMEKTTVKGECRGIPQELKVGTVLPGYNIEIKVMFIKSKVSMQDRKVIGRETITVPAGTFDCFVVEETMTASAMMMKEKTVQKTWYARGIGMVRQEVWDKNKKKKESTSVLSSITY